LPLAIASGANDTNSHHIGTTVAMGMVSVAVLASLFVPAFYAMIANVQVWLQNKRGVSSHHEDDDEASATSGPPANH
jgi:HAE1 family hydrophobic/amphiphilic exporter-1/multidrug efflux pump